MRLSRPIPALNSPAEYCSHRPVSHSKLSQPEPSPRPVHLSRATAPPQLSRPGPECRVCYSELPPPLRVGRRPRRAPGSGSLVGGRPLGARAWKIGPTDRGMPIHCSRHGRRERGGGEHPPPSAVNPDRHPPPSHHLSVCRWEVGRERGGGRERGRGERGEGGEHPLPPLGLLVCLFLSKTDHEAETE